MFGAVICSRCGRAKAVDLRHKASRCQCGCLLKLNEMRKFFKSASQREVAKAVADLNARIQGGYEDLSPKRPRKDPHDPYSRIASEVSSLTGVNERLEVVARRLTDLLGFFTAQEFEKVARMLGIKDAEPRLRLLMRENIIYEPRPGVYSAV